MQTKMLVHTAGCWRSFGAWGGDGGALKLLSMVWYNSAGAMGAQIVPYSSERCYRQAQPAVEELPQVGL